MQRSREENIFCINGTSFTGNIFFTGNILCLVYTLYGFQLKLPEFKRIQLKV